MTASTTVILFYMPTFVPAVIGKDKYSEIGKKGYIKNGNNDAVETATSVQ